MLDIRKDVPGLWCDDITFCSMKCTWTNCPRNQKNIRDKTALHSYCVDVPSDCPKKLSEMEAKQG